MNIMVLGEALMDCISQADGSLRPLKGGSPYNAARAASLQGAKVAFLNPFSNDAFGADLKALLLSDGVQCLGATSRHPTSLAVVNLVDGQPSYGFYRQGIADRDYSAAQIIDQLRQHAPGVLHTGSLMLIPPESDKIAEVLRGAKDLGWTLSVDVNMRPSVAPELGAYVAAVREIMPLADWLKASDEDLATLGYTTHTPADAAAMAHTLHALGPKRVALTYGADGAVLSIDGHATQADVPVVTVTDTVGAGDTFWGSLLAQWAQTPADQAAALAADHLRQAMRAAAINCTRQGCQPPTRAELDASPI